VTVRMIRRIALVGATMLSASLAVPAYGQQPRLPARAGAPRPALEQLAQVVQRRLGLNADQAARLRETTGRFAAQRQQLMQRERETRRALRQATAAGDSADQKVIAQQIDALVRLQQQRVALVSDEQRELSAFMTPYQRAQFLAMQERAFRAAQQLRQQRAARRQPLP